MVSTLFNKTAHLLAQESHYIQCVPELAELRNLLLLGGSSTHSINQIPWKFLDAKLLKNSNYGRSIKPINGGEAAFTTAGFYADYGRPNSAIFNGGKLISFWPDEWQKLLGCEKSIGHLLQFYSKSQSRWLVGKVIQYDIASDKYIIQLDKSFLVNQYGEVEINPQIDVENTVEELSIHLEGRCHHWIDTFNKEKVGHSSVTHSIDSKLTFSDKDVGKFIRIWWSRYSKFFYGTVVAFNYKDKNHTVKYEDSDVRLVYLISLLNV